MITRKPAASSISRLLASAGFARAVIGASAGFKAEKCRTRAGAVKVRAFFQDRMPDPAYSAMLRQYRDVIEAAGYSTEIYAYTLIVTARAEAGQ